MGNRHGKGPAQRPGKENSQTASPKTCRFSFTAMIKFKFCDDIREDRVRL